MAAAPDLFAATSEIAALRESEARLRAIFDNTEDFILGTDLEGRITNLNPALERLIGLPLDQIIGRPFVDFVAPEWRSQPADAARAKLSGRVQQTVYDLELLTGLTVDVIAAGDGLDDDLPTGRRRPHAVLLTDPHRMVPSGDALRGARRRRDGCRGSRSPT